MKMNADSRKRLDLATLQAGRTPQSPGEPNVGFENGIRLLRVK